MPKTAEMRRSRFFPMRKRKESSQAVTSSLKRPQQQSLFTLADLCLYLDGAAASAPMPVPPTTTGSQTHTAAAAEDIAANVSHHLFSIHCKCNDCIEYCPPVLNAARPDELTSGRRKPGRPRGAHNKSKSPPPPIKAPVAIWNSHAMSLEKSVEEGQ
jgi:hypothetical protein